LTYTFFVGGDAQEMLLCPSEVIKNQGDAIVSFLRVLFFEK